MPHATTTDKEVMAGLEIPPIPKMNPEAQAAEVDEMELDEEAAPYKQLGVEEKAEAETQSSDEAAVDKKPVKVEDDLDNLFDDDDALASINLPSSSMAISSQLDLSDPQVMLTFYQRLFPWRQLFQWLNHAVIPTTAFSHREFAFTLSNDAYLRYQSFPTFETLRKEVLRLNPKRFEIGPVYSANPRDKKTLKKAAFRPLEKELVFDIDLTDYDDIRTCCAATTICNKCWQFITMAVKVVDVALREDFGFKYIMWVYSGRRGAHAWVCDKKARLLDDAKRKAVVTYLEVVKGGAQSGKKVNPSRPLHPHLARSLDILKDSFAKDILQDQDPWKTEKQAERLLQLLPDRNLVEALKKKWDAVENRPSASKWADINSVAESGASDTLQPKALKEAKQDILLEYTYPRLDMEVSKKLNHLLKSPFCVHPNTGRVCVPMDPAKMDEFDPEGVPTVLQLLEELNAWKKEHPEVEGERRMEDWKKTSLKPYINWFEGFVQGLMREGGALKREHDSMEF